MSPPSRPRADCLWRRLADAQDAALLGEPLFRGVVPAARRAPSLRRRRLGLAAAALGVAAAVAVPLLRPGRALRFQMARTGERGAAGRALMADARSDLPLAFSDGLTVTFRAGSSGRVERLTGQGAEVILERGSLDAHVVHARATIWRVYAGPFQVRVTGTRFSTRWSGERLEVALYEGGVVVDGALLGTGVPLRAGQRLTIEAGVVRIEPLAPPAPPSPAPAGADPEAPARGAAAPRPAAAGRGDDGEWLALAGRGEYAEALRSADRLGWGGLCRRADAGRLLTLGDVARYAGAEAQARQAFEALVSRFPRDRQAADAVFSLGRLAYEAHDPERAARWFRRYVDDWPRGPLADQAAGRLIECAVRVDDREGARGAARAYLARAPRGPHAALARQVLLADPPDGAR